MRLHRPLGGMLALVLTLSMPLAAADAPKVDGDGLFPIELTTVLMNPESLRDAKVKFRCTFAAVTDLFDFERTSFRPERFAAIAIWDDRAKLWQPEARADVVTTVFIAKDRITPTRSTSLRKYQQLEIAGVVKDVVEGVPQIEVIEIRPIKGGQFTDAAIYHVEQALALIGDGARDLAEEHFASALTSDLPVPAQIEISTLRGSNLIDAGRFAEAAAVIGSAVNKAMGDGHLPNEDRAQLYALLAKAQSELAERTDATQRQAAVDNARKALTYNPANGEAYAVLGISLAGMGQFDEARRHCDNAVRLRPADAEVRWYLGRILDQQGRSDEAIDALKKAIDLTPKDFRIHRAIASAYYHRGLKGGPTAGQDLSTALREYDITLRLNPGDAEILVLSGQVIEAAAKAGAEIQVGTVRQPATVELALARYRAAVQMNNHLASAWSALGLLSVTMNHLDDAKMAAEKLTALGDTAGAEQLNKLLTVTAPAAAPTTVVPTIVPPTVAAPTVADPTVAAPTMTAPTTEAPIDTVPAAPAVVTPPAPVMVDPSLPAQMPDAIPAAEPLPPALPVAEPLPTTAPTP